MPTEVPIIGDARESLAALLPLLPRKADRYLEKSQEAMEGWRPTWKRWRPQAQPDRPQYPVAIIDDLAADDAILTCDSGTIATWAARHLTIRGERKFYLSGNLATMAPGLPYTIGIQHAFPAARSSPSSVTAASPC